MTRVLTVPFTAMATRLVVTSQTWALTPGVIRAPGIDDGFRLAAVVIPVLVIALIWLAYIFWLIFHGEQDGKSS